MKPLRWQTDKESAAYMLEMKRRNVSKALCNSNENWMRDKLASKTQFKWSRQATWGFRIFDFWNAALGIAVEVDGPEHDPKYDSYRDEYNFRRSGVVVLRVRNRNEDDAVAVIGIIVKSDTLADRKKALGIIGTTKKEKRRLVNFPYPPSLLDEYITNKAVGF